MKLRSPASALTTPPDDERTARCVLQPCGHAGVCLACGREQAACPVCRAPVERAQRIY